MPLETWCAHILSRPQSHTEWTILCSPEEGWIAPRQGSTYTHNIMHIGSAINTSQYRKKRRSSYSESSLSVIHYIHRGYNVSNIHPFEGIWALICTNTKAYIHTLVKQTDNATCSPFVPHNTVKEIPGQFGWRRERSSRQCFPSIVDTHLNL